jgi:predicted secreted Zn-dependent protease
MANVKVDIKINNPKVTHFQVRAKTLAEAKKVLDKRPKGEWGLYDTTKTGKTDRKLDRDGNVTSVTLVFNPTIVLPQWSGYGSATKAQRASWDAMMKALEAHERKHHDIQVDRAADMKKAIENAGLLDEGDLNKIISDQKDACQDAQDTYDVRSGHGANEGVVLNTGA